MTTKKVTWEYNGDSGSCKNIKFNVELNGGDTVVDTSDLFYETTSSIDIGKVKIFTYCADNTNIYSDTVTQTFPPVCDDIKITLPTDTDCIMVSSYVPSSQKPYLSSSYITSKFENVSGCKSIQYFWYSSDKCNPEYEEDFVKAGIASANSADTSTNSHGSVKTKNVNVLWMHQYPQTIRLMVKCKYPPDSDRGDFEYCGDTITRIYTNVSTRRINNYECLVDDYCS